MKFIRADYIIIIAFLLMLGTHSITMYLIAKYTDPKDVIESGKAIVAVSEGNPFAAFFLQFEKLRLLYSLVFLPAVLFSLYYYIRQKYINRDVIIVELFAITAAMIALINFMNDAGYLAGYLVR